MRIRSTTFICLLQWTRSSSLRDFRQDDHTLEITSIFALLVVRSIAMLALPTTCLSSLPNCHEPLTFVTLPSKPLFGYVTALAQPPLIALLVAGEVEDCSMSEHEHVGISQYPLF